MNAIKTEVSGWIETRRAADARAMARGRISAEEAARDERGYNLLAEIVETHPEIVAIQFRAIRTSGTNEIILTARQCGHNITVKGF